MDDQRTKPCCVMLEQLTPVQQTSLSAELRNTINSRNILTTRTKTKLLTDLDEIHKVNVEKDWKNHKEKAIREIITSEVSYLNQLEIIKKYFMKPIQEQAILSADLFQTLFGSINTIYNVNSELLRELRRNPDKIANTFAKIAPFLKLYSVYAYDYKKSLSILQNAATDNSSLSKFLDMQESRPEVQMKLSALLITPIQRVPRYKLLLKQVLNNTSPRDPAYSQIIDSLKQVEQAANHINNLLEKQESTQRLLELQRSLQNKYPSIIKPDRKLLKEGFLIKISSNSDRSYKRYFVLMNDILMCCKLKKANPNLANSLKCSWIFPLSKCKIVEMLSKGAFRIVCQDVEITVRHEHADKIRDWANVIKDAIKVYTSNKKTLRKDSSNRRPVYKKYLHEYTDVGISPGKPRKKRKLEEVDFENVFKSAIDDSEDSDAEPRKRYIGKVTKRKRSQDSDTKPQKWFNMKLTKRKPIGKSDDNPTPSKIAKKEDLDSLFPLRHHFKQEEDEESEHSTGSSKRIEETNNDVFVFGRADQPKRSFTFTMSNVLCGLGNSVKKWFGFKNN